MLIWHLQRIYPKGKGPLNHLGCLDRGVVQAPSEQEARQQMAEVCAEEGPDLWLDPKQSSCEQMPVAMFQPLTLYID